jgi:hypothetical protein
MKRFSKKFILLPLAFVISIYAFVACNGNLTPHDNCTAGILYGMDQGWFQGSWGTWDSYFEAEDNGGIDWICRVVSFDGQGYDGFAVMVIEDEDSAAFGSPADAWSMGFPSFDGWGRYDLRGTASECQQKIVANQYPLGTKCSGTWAG